jgi:tetratricopeptide (TPR) repeat protein
VAALWAASLLAIAALVAAGFGFALMADQERQAAEARGQAAEAREEKAIKEAEAAREAERANWISDALLVGIFDDPLGVNEKPYHFPKEVGKKKPLGDFLKHAKKDAERFTAKPETHAKLLRSIGNAYHTLGDFDEAEPLLRESLRLLRAKHGNADHLEIAESLSSLAALLHVRGDYDAAKELYEETLEIRRRLLMQAGKPRHDPLLTSILHSLAWIYADMEDFDAAKQRFEEVLRLCEERRDNPPEPDGALDNERHVALAKLELAGLGIKEKLDRSTYAPLVIAIRRLVELEKDKELSDALGLVESAFVARAFLPTIAVKHLAKARHLAAKRFNRDHIYVAAVTYFLAETLQETGKLDEAEKEYKECLDIIDKTVGFGHAKAADVVGSFARLLHKQGKRAQADFLFNQVIRAQEERFSPNHFRVANALMVRAQLLAEWGDLATAEQVAQRALEVYKITGAERRRMYRPCCDLLIEVRRRQAKG